MSPQNLIQVWNDWQLSSLVLLSLFLQLLFLFTASRRRCTRPSTGSKAYFWCLYNLSSPIAIYALGILSRATAGQADADIQAFWAALLLFHLGGVDDFTALSLEDNKLWVRRCFTLAVQATTTAYVFFHYFKDPAFRCFIVPFWLIFLAGLLKCVEQVLALQQATMEALIGSVLGIPDPGPDYADTMDRVDGILRSGVLPSINIDNERGDRPSSDSPMTDKVEAKQNKDRRQEALGIIRSAHVLFSRFNVLFADGIFSFKDRQDSQAQFVNKDVYWSFRVVEMEMSFVYDRLYTKASVSRTIYGLPIRILSLVLTLAGSLWTLIAFGRSRSRYRLRNRCVTYTLLAGAVVTEVVTLAFYVFSIWSLAHGRWLEWCSGILLNGRRWWSGYMAQSNLISFCLQELPSRSKLHDFIRKGPVDRWLNRGSRGNMVDQLPAAIIGKIFAQELRAGFLSFRRPPSNILLRRSFWSKYEHTKHVPVSKKLKAIIFDEMRKKEKEFNHWEGNRQRKAGGILDSHNPFTAYRGDRVLKDQEITGLEWSLQQKDFDESLLIWHIATDLCFRQEDSQLNTRADRDQDTYSSKDMARELSNYLFYIMVVHPLMLSPPTTMAVKRCKDTCAEARRHLLKEHLLHMRRTSTTSEGGGDGAVSEDNAHKLLLKVETPLPASVVKGDKSKSVLWDGCFLAKELDRIMQDDPEKKWEVMSKVWVEMLCYAAIHCGGYQHAERLKEGGELITFVCLLMTHLGMGKHYRTEVGDAYAHLTAYTAA